MRGDFKKLLKQLIILSISFLLLPTILDLIFKNSDQQINVSSEISFTFFAIQSLGIVIGSLSGTIYFIIYLKERKALQTLSVAEEQDAAWDIGSLKIFVNAVSSKIQEAIQTKNESSLQGYTTPEFLIWFKNIIEQMDVPAEKVILTDIHIISCKDSDNNSKDKFVGYVKGYLQSQTNSEKNRDFSEIYHFIRTGNSWLLQKITSSNIFNVLLA